MKIIWTFTLLMIPGVLSSISVTGYSGGGVSITCRYDRGYTDNNKYFCRGQNPGCKDLIKTDIKDKLVDSERFSLYDDTRAAVFTVTIRDLREQDSGTYQCAVDKSWTDSYTEVKLNVVTAADCCQKSISLSAAAGASVNISCRYPQSHRADVKFVCRRSGSDLCAEETSVKESRRWSAEGQMQLYDDREQQLLTGIISHVTQQHSAEYWCGVQSDGGHKSFITRVLISVTDGSPLVSSVSPITGSSLIISVSVLLLLIVTVTLWRRRQSHNTHSSFKRSQSTPANIDAAAHYRCDYEETEDSHRQLPTNPSGSTNAIYSDPELPTNPSDSTNAIYANPELPTNPSGSTNAIYSDPELPTNPSDSTNAIYATPQLPINPSDSTNTIYANPELP
ncbi:uncharacterized protein LOC132144120 [Carassius carassius]|uniref:uncharacterized protein LOC132144120 n=1 Tax=Carassius carassius TaxID=217509 RepID=UPI002868DB32|nr:uncharacterized protein LOC132144120 [Carassius carassius]